MKSILVSLWLVGFGCVFSQRTSLKEKLLSLQFLFFRLSTAKVGDAMLTLVEEVAALEQQLRW